MRVQACPQRKRIAVRRESQQAKRGRIVGGRAPLRTPVESTGHGGVKRQRARRRAIGCHSSVALASCQCGQVYRRGFVTTKRAVLTSAIQSSRTFEAAGGIPNSAVTASLGGLVGQGPWQLARRCSRRRCRRWRRRRAALPKASTSSSVVDRRVRVERAARGGQAAPADRALPAHLPAALTLARLACQSSNAIASRPCRRPCRGFARRLRSRRRSRGRRSTRSRDWYSSMRVAAALLDQRRLGGRGEDAVVAVDFGEQLIGGVLAIGQQRQPALHHGRHVAQIDLHVPNCRAVARDRRRPPATARWWPAARCPS